MLFPTLSFAVFFALVLPASWLLMPHRVRWRVFMIGVSWFFYGAADWRFVPLLAGSTLVNHLFARLIHRSEGTPRRLWTIAAVTANIAVLCWFKYVGFLSLTLQSTLHAVGIKAHVPLPEVVLPVGISFFTFQALSYVIDTSRRKIVPSSLLDFAVYLSFFPHLIAGPIVRATEFLPQIKEKIDPRKVDVAKAFWLISLGLFKKVVIASYLGTYAADPLFGFPHQHAGFEALFGVYAYAVQIYMDFSGYTDIAIGLALLLGIRFPQNFNAPYAASSLQDFWRRWHMTLSRWLRDYLYIPLGGNRQSEARTYVNVMITMLLGGLWHGAAWTFVAWGALHGIGLCVERRWRGRGDTPGKGDARAKDTPGKGAPPSNQSPPVPVRVSAGPAVASAAAHQATQPQRAAEATAAPSRPAMSSLTAVQVLTARLPEHDKNEPFLSPAPDDDRAPWPDENPDPWGKDDSPPTAGDDAEPLADDGSDPWADDYRDPWRDDYRDPWRDDYRRAGGGGARGGEEAGSATGARRGSVPSPATGTLPPPARRPVSPTASRAHPAAGADVTNAGSSDPGGSAGAESGHPPSTDADQLPGMATAEAELGADPGTTAPSAAAARGRRPRPLRPLASGRSESALAPPAVSDIANGSPSGSTAASASTAASVPGTEAPAAITTEPPHPAGSESAPRSGSSSPPVDAGHDSPPAGGRPTPAQMPPWARRWIGWFITFHLVCLAWIFFRATSFHNAVEVIGRIVDLGGRHQPLKWKVVAVVVGSLAFQLGPRGAGERLQILFSRCSLWAQVAILAGFLTVLDLLGPAGVAPFIYFKF